MSRIPTLERAPGIPEPWLGYWRASLTQSKSAGAWNAALRPLLDRYIGALRRADELRQVLDDPEVTFAQRDAALVNADREERRAIALASKLGLVSTRMGARAPGKDASGTTNDNGVAADAFAELDELAPLREKRAA
jgi:sugar phosphate isomerase/epimerase